VHNYYISIIGLIEDLLFSSEDKVYVNPSLKLFVKSEPDGKGFFGNGVVLKLLNLKSKEKDQSQFMGPESSNCCHKGL
jgi:hypothetical protein